MLDLVGAVTSERFMWFVERATDASIVFPFPHVTHANTDVHYATRWVVHQPMRHF